MSYISKQFILDSADLLVKAATTIPLPANTYSNVNGGKLTANINGVFPTIDDVTINLGDVFLSKNEIDGIGNGFLVLSDAGSGSTPWIAIRATNANTDTLVAPGMARKIQHGTQWQGSTFALTNTGIITLGVTALRFVRLESYIDIRLFGAVPDALPSGTHPNGSTGTNNTPALNAAITAAISSGFGVVLVPPGNYRFTTAPTPIPQAVTITGVGGSSGGVSGDVTVFSTFIHDYDGDFLIFNGANGLTLASGGGVERLRIVQTYGATAGTTKRGTAIKLISTDTSHRPSWIKLRLLIIEELGNDVWDWAIDCDGSSNGTQPTSIISDLYLGEISTHTGALGQGGTSGALRLKNCASPIIYNSNFYVGGYVEVDGVNASGRTGSAQFVGVTGTELRLKTCVDTSVVGGIWSAITQQSFDMGTGTGTTGTVSLHPARLVNDFVSGDTAVGVSWYRAIALGTAPGYYRYSKPLALGSSADAGHTNAIVGINHAKNNIFDVISTDTSDNVIVGGVGWAELHGVGGSTTGFIIAGSSTDFFGGGAHALAIISTKVTTFLPIEFSNLGETAQISLDATNLSGPGGESIGNSFRLGAPVSLSNSQYIYSLGAGGLVGQVVATIGLDVNNNLRLAPFADALVVVGAPPSLGSATAGDMSFADGRSLWFNTRRFISSDGSGHFVYGQDFVTASFAGMLLATSAGSLLQSSVALDMQSHKITNVTDPTNAQDAATKNYIDARVGGVNQVTVGATALALNGHVDTTVTVTGAIFGTDMAVVSPVTAPDGNVGWCAWVSATDTVTVRVFALAAFTTTSTTYSVRIIKG